MISCIYVCQIKIASNKLSVLWAKTTMWYILFCPWLLAPQIFTPNYTHIESALKYNDVGHLVKSFATRYKYQLIIKIPKCVI